MKKGILLCVILTVAMLWTGCENKKTEGNDTSQAMGQAEENVEITVPKEILGGYEYSDYVKEAEDIGLRAEINDDSSVVYTMTVSQRDYMLKQMERNIQSAWEKIKNRDGSNIENIENNEGYTVVTIVTNGEIRDKDEVCKLIYKSCRYRQIIAGEGENQGLSLKIKDKNTGEIIEKTAY